MPTKLPEAEAAELCAMADADLALRRRIAATGELHNGYHPEMAELHERNAMRLAEIVVAHGWPTEARAGARASEAAWLVAQHAIGVPPLQRALAHRLIDAAAHGEAPAWQAAMIEDRVRILEGRLQRFGTQFDWNDAGVLAPQPIEDPEHVDDRRRQIGLGTLAERQAELAAQAALDGEAPLSDPAARREGFERWARDTGWRS